MDRLVEMVRLYRHGVTHRKAAEMLRMGPNQHRQAREAFRRAGLWDGAADVLPEAEVLRALLPQRLPRQQISSAESWRPDIAEMMSRGGNAKVIHDRLCLECPGFHASYEAVKRLVRSVRRRQPLHADDVVIPVESEPGRIAQVDFGYVGMVIDPATGKPRKAWLFVMSLGFSRHFFARVVFDQSVPTWLDLHVRAFEFFGGVPKVLVPDNLKAAVIRCAFGVDENVEAQQNYREIARHYGFLIDPTPPRSPKLKGKVERMVQYVTPYLVARDPSTDIAALNKSLDQWNREIASLRRHNTTKKVPHQQFHEVEFAALLPLPTRRWVPTLWRQREVQRDAHVQFDGRSYSVPWRLIGKQLWLRATPDRVVIFDDGTHVGEHDRCGPGHRSTVPGHLPSVRAAFAERSPEYWVNRAAAIGPEAEAWAEDLLTTPVVSELRVVQATVVWLESFDRIRAEAICSRAREYNVRKLGGMKNIARLGLDRRVAVATPPSATDPTTYARTLAELFQGHLGDAHAHH